MGTNLLGLMKGAETLGFAAKAAKGPFEALKSCPLPLIVHVLDEIPGLAGVGLLGHFYVVFKVTDKTVEVADPARGPRKFTREEFEKKWTGALMLLVPTPKLAGVRASMPSWRRFLGLLSGRWSLFVESIIAAILFAALGLGSSFYVQYLVDDVLLHGNARLLH